MSKKTIYDLAKACGYSVSTVSKAMSGNKAISEKTRKHIEDIAKQMGYHPYCAAQMLSQNKKTVAVILPNNPSPLYNLLSEGLKDAEEKYADYPIEFCHYYFTYDALKSNLIPMIKKASVCDALVMYMGYITAEDVESISRDYADKPIATICANENGISGASDIRSDAYGIGKLAGDIIYPIVGKNGFAVMICGMSNSDVHRQNICGFRASSENYGFSIGNIYYTDDSYAHIHQTAEEAIINNPEATAIFVSTSLAKAVCDAAKAMNRPDIRIVAVDLTDENIEALKNGEITAIISQNHKMQIKRAVDHAVRRLLKLRGAPIGYNECVIRPEVIYKSNLRYHI